MDFDKLKNSEGEQYEYWLRENFKIIGNLNV